MDISNVELKQIYDWFPLLKKANFQKTSKINEYYNCIAWALGIKNLWWWPGPKGFWPQDCLREETILAFVEVFGSFRYEQYGSGNLEKGYAKIALYAQGDTPTHAARQLKDGRWSSKLGGHIDIRHDLVDLEGEIYGKVVKFFRRSTDVS